MFRFHKVMRVFAVLVAAGMGLLNQMVMANTLEGINHTNLDITRFSVNGHSGVDVIGPHQVGGVACCYVVPVRWEPGMTVRIDWETGLSGSKGFPGYADDAKYEAWAENFEAQKRRHSKLVMVPDYTGQEICGITVHFLPCDDIKVTTSCYGYGNREYPIKTPLNLPEPKSCQK